MGARSRNKGAEAERAAARILSIVFPDAQRRCSGEESQDEVRGRDLRGTPGFCFQVKETGAPQPLAALAEAIAAAEAGEIPAALVRQSRRGSSTPLRVVLRLEDFLRLASAFRGARPDAFAIRGHLEQLAATGDAMAARVR